MINKKLGKNIIAVKGESTDRWIRLLLQAGCQPLISGRWDSRRVARHGFRLKLSSAPTDKDSTARVWIESFIYRKIMGKKQSSPSTSRISRRTGIDRRWIPSGDHHPERRSGKDRRSRQDRPFLAPLDANDRSGHPLSLPGTPLLALLPAENHSDGADAGMDSRRTSLTPDHEDPSDEPIENL